MTCAHTHQLTTQTKNLQERMKLDLPTDNHFYNKHVPIQSHQQKAVLLRILDARHKPRLRAGRRHTSRLGGQTLAKASRLAASEVSRTVPSKKTTRRSLTVWYVFWETPQHMPEELLETIPPTMQLSIEEGSGPILYWTSWPPRALCSAKNLLTSPPMMPGSTVISLPSPCTNPGQGKIRPELDWRRLQALQVKGHGA